MVNRAATEFVKRLVAAFSRWPAGKDTVDLYTEKLSKWTLSPVQWDRALDALIEAHQDENLPGLQTIYTALRNASYAGRSGSSSNLGWVSFQHNGRSYSVRAYCEQEIWLIAPLRYRDQRGNMVELQKNVGKPVAVHIPRDAQDVVCTPDNPARLEPHDMPTREERAELAREMGRVSEGHGRRIA